MPSLSRPDGSDVFLLDLGEDENRFNPDWMGSVTGLLAEVVAAPAPRALVVLASGPKIWSNGLDLDWLTANAEKAGAFVDQVHGVFADFLAAGVPTVAAVTGHAFAGGAMLALSCDFRVMRTDRGYFCLPEVDIQIPFTPGMAALIQSRLTKRAAHEAMTTGRRYTAAEALDRGIVDDTAPLEEVVPRAVALAAGLASKTPHVLAEIKQTMYADAIAVLRTPSSGTSAPGV